jgi:hypothetical protein
MRKSTEIDEVGWERGMEGGLLEIRNIAARSEK